jgi:O-antigen ligase
MSAGERALAVGLGLLLLVVLPGRGGQAVVASLVWHGWLLLLVLGALLAPAALAPRRRRVARGPLAAFGLLVGLAGAGAVVAPYAYAAVLMLVELAAFGAAAWLAARCGVGLLRGVATPLLLAALAQSLLVFWQRASGEALRPAGTLENPNHLGSWLVAVLVLNLGIAVAPGGGSRRSRALRATALTVPLGAILLGGSRGALLGLGAALGYLLLRRWRDWPRPVRLGAVAGVILLGLVFGGRQVQRLGDADPFRYHRVRIWSASLASVGASPWTGVGPRQFVPAAANLQFPDGDGPLRYDRVFTRTHSDPLRVLVELGWPGALALGLALVATCGALLRRPPPPADRAGVELGAVAALAALGTHALVANPSERPAVFLLAAVLLGGLLSRPAGPVVSTRRWPLASRVALAAVLGLAFLVAEVGPYRAWRATDELPPGHLGDADLARLELALASNPAHADYHLRLALHVASGPSWDLAAYASARELAERAIRLQPADARYRAGAARIEARAARTLFAGDAASRRRAALRFLEAEALARYNPFLPLERGALLLDTGDAAGAARAARRALAIEPESAAARLVLAEATLASGSAPRAAELLDEARSVAERWKDAHLENPESAKLLELEPRAVERVEARMAELGREP